MAATDAHGGDALHLFRLQSRYLQQALEESITLSVGKVELGDGSKALPHLVGSHAFSNQRVRETVGNYGVLVRLQATMLSILNESGASSPRGRLNLSSHMKVPVSTEYRVWMDGNGTISVPSLVLCGKALRGNGMPAASVPQNSLWKVTVSPELVHLPDGTRPTSSSKYLIVLRGNLAVPNAIVSTESMEVDRGVAAAQFYVKCQEKSSQVQGLIAADDELQIPARKTVRPRIKIQCNSTWSPLFERSMTEEGPHESALETILRLCSISPSNVWEASGTFHRLWEIAHDMEQAELSWHALRAFAHTVQCGMRRRGHGKSEDTEKGATSTREPFPLKLILGAYLDRQPGWVGTDYRVLDLLQADDFEGLIPTCPTENQADKRESEPPPGVSALLAEHVWEHFSIKDAIVALHHCFSVLSDGGYLRIAVPDWYFSPRNTSSVAWKGDIGSGHLVQYNLPMLQKLLEVVGFEVDVLEAHDVQGQFVNEVPWDDRNGKVRRSGRHDVRGSVSIIVDAKKIAHLPPAIVFNGSNWEMGRDSRRFCDKCELVGTAVDLYRQAQAQFGLQIENGGAGHFESKKILQQLFIFIETFSQILGEDNSNVEHNRCLSSLQWKSAQSMGEIFASSFLSPEEPSLHVGTLARFTSAFFWFSQALNICQKLEQDSSSSCRLTHLSIGHLLHHAYLASSSANLNGIPHEYFVNNQTTTLFHLDQSLLYEEFDQNNDSKSSAIRRWNGCSCGTTKEEQDHIRNMHDIKHTFVSTDVVNYSHSPLILKAGILSSQGKV